MARGLPVDPELCRYCIHKNVCYVKVLEHSALANMTSCDGYCPINAPLNALPHQVVELIIEQSNCDQIARVRAEHEARLFLRLYKDAVDFISRIGRFKEYDTGKRLRRKYKRGVWRYG